MKRTNKSIFTLFLFFVISSIILIAKYLNLHASFNIKVNLHAFLSFYNSFESNSVLVTVNYITTIQNTKHFAVSAFTDHRIKEAIRVISIIKRDSKQSLYCIYGNSDRGWQFSKAKVEIHTDHFNFPFGAADILCHGEETQNATHVAISTDANVSNIHSLTFLPLKNKVESKTFKFNFTICISSLFGGYNNVLQFAQTMEMYKLLGVQHVVIYNTSNGPDLEKLLQYYKKQGILEIVPWPIDQFLNPSVGWNFQTHKGDLQYYGQLVTLNECIYRNMYQSKYVLLNDIDEIIMPYKHNNLALMMDALQQQNKRVGVFYIENHIFPKTQFDKSGKFHRPEWINISGINIMEHIYREPDRKNIYNPKKMIINPRNVFQTSVHSTLKHTGKVYNVPNDVCRIVHVRTPLQASLPKEKLLTDTRVWDFEQELVPNVNTALRSSGPPQDHFKAGINWVLDHSQHCSDNDMGVWVDQTQQRCWSFYTPHCHCWPENSPPTKNIQPTAPCVP